MNRKVCKLTERIVFLVFILYGSVSSAQVQNRLSGRVIDAATRNPVPFANVFFANTTMGMSTREDGTFTIEKFPSGKYDLTVTSIGFRTFQQALDFTIPHRQVVEILIHENAVELNEVVVREDTTGWKSNYQMFKKLFIGTTSYAKDCSIASPKDIHLYFDPQTSDLTAHSKLPIEVTNRALGLRIIYHLATFEYNYKTGTFVVTGMPLIQYLTPRSKHQEKKWIHERKRTYYGSVMHFMRVLLRDSLIEDGFAVRKMYPVRNKKRLPQKLLDEKLKKFRSEMRTSGNVMVGPNDSLNYYLRMNREPEFKDSIAAEKLTASRLLKGTESIDYLGKLHVMYEKEKEEWAYAQSLGKSTRTDQTSVLHFKGQQPLRIYTNGYFESQIDVFMEGYWSWSEKISCLLPLDYEPDRDVPKLK